MHRRLIQQRRRGIVTLEVLGVMPILLLFAMSIAEFSMAMRVHQKVAFASRFGAKLASEVPRVGAGSLAELNTVGNTSSLKTRVDEWLIATGLSPSLAVRLEHNACGVANTDQILSATDSLPDDTTRLPLPPADGVLQVCYVRVTVWLPLEPNLPNALRTFGLNWTGASVSHSTTFRLEADNQPPAPEIELLANDLPQGYELQPIDEAAADGPRFRITTDRNGPVELRFSARNSRDAESGSRRLTYRWKTDGTPVGRNTQAEFRARMQLSAKQQTQRIQVALDVSDECSCSSKLMLPVELTRPELTKGP